MVKHYIKIFYFFRKIISRMSKITNWLSTALMVLVFLSVAPGLISNIKKQYQEALKPHVTVASIGIHSEIKETEDYIKQLNKYFKDKSVKAILLQIDSPGGQAGSSQAIFNEIQNLKKEYPKPIVALTNNCCASGAYYIACTADHIITAPSAMVGSIGVVMGFFNVNEVLKKYNVNYISKHSGAYKTVGTPYLPQNPEQEKMLQELSDNIYNQFTNDVAACRKLSLKETDKWANGRIFSGEQAQKLGLIDEIGSKCTAIKKIKELALIKDEEEITWLEEAEPNIISKFLSSKTSSNANYANEIADVVINKLNSSFISCN
jgi:protease-4